jgi:hypothetical protein
MQPPRSLEYELIVVLRKMHVLVTTDFEYDGQFAWTTILKRDKSIGRKIEVRYE